MTTTAPAAPGVAVSATGLVKVYGEGETGVAALDGVDVTFPRGRFTAVMGPSGSGKSTLLHCLAGLDRPTGGRVEIGGQDITGMDDDRLTRLRRDHIGFVFQAYNLVPTLNVLENITLPMDVAGREPDRELLAAIVEVVGLWDRLGHRPAQLSGGQQQRVACARALASGPEVVLADEPTGNLDSRSGGEVLGFLRRAADELGQTIVMVTHDPTAGLAGRPGAVPGRRAARRRAVRAHPRARPRADAAARREEELTWDASRSAPWPFAPWPRTGRAWP